MANENTSANSDQLSRERTIWVAAYNIGICIVMALLLYSTIIKASKLSYAAAMQKRETAAKANKPAAAPIPKPAAITTDTSHLSQTTDTMTANAPDTVISQGQPNKAEDDTPADPKMISYVLIAISLAGGLGGALSNLRGVFEFSRDQQYFPAYLELPFYLRPFSGAICGLFTFFLGTFFAGALAPGDNSGWQTLQGMFPYIGIAFVAGFASQEFMERLKETAKTLFGVPTTTTPDPAPVAVIPPPNGDDGHESFSIRERGLDAPPSLPPAPTPPPTVVPPVIKGRRAD